MATVTRTSTGTAVSGTAGITVLPGAGAAVGDFGLIIVETANQTMAAPSGWATWLEGAGTGTAGAAGATRLIIMRRSSIVAADISPGVTLADSGDHQIAVFLTYSAGTTIFSSSTEFVGTPATTSANTNGTGGSTTVTGSIMLAIFGTDRDSATVSTNSGGSWFNATGVDNGFIVNVSTATGAGGGIIVDELLVTSTPSIASFSFTMTSSIYTSFAMTLSPPSAPPFFSRKARLGYMEL